MFGEQASGQFGRVILFTGEQRGGADGGPVCRFVLDSRSGALLDLGRIDCFAIEPHHHTQTPRINEAGEYPLEIRTDLAEPRRRLTADEWRECALRAVAWLRDDWSRELRESGWGEWVIQAVEREKAGLVAAVQEFLLSHPPTGLQPE
ncbi:MAG TPA: hypothetical protein VFU47_10395 [Armatimonadota bacterium]|nr:hypothetical protein [Armatimonadota bacterium]